MARTIPPPATWRRLLPALLFAGVPIALIAAFAAQLVFATSMPWERALRVSLHHWFVPFLVAGLGWVVARAFPLERGRLRWVLPLYLITAALVVALAGRVEQGIFPAAPAPRGALPGWSESHPGTAHHSPPEGIGGRMGGGRRGAGMPNRHFLTMLASSRWQLHLAVLGVSLSLTHAWSLYRSVEERDRRALELTTSLSQAKLEALRLQLQPHFLFNALNAISTLVHRDANAADEMIADLSELLRLSLEIREQEVPLRRELDILDRYLAIEQVRLGHRLRIERHIDDSTLDGLVPSLVLQPVVENAIRHGLEPRAAPGTITLHAERCGDRLRLVVADDGPGFKPVDPQTERRGIGLANTEARLRELHGTAAGLILRQPPEGGVHVEIELPFRTT